MTMITLREMREEDLPELFEIQLDQDAQRMAAFMGEAANDREAYLRKWKLNLADPQITARVIMEGGEIVGSVGSYVMDGDTEVTYWIRRDRWGRGLAGAALAALLDEVTVRPIYGRAAADNAGSRRVLERNGFVYVGEERAFARARQDTITEVIYKLTAPQDTASDDGAGGSTR